MKLVLGKLQQDLDARLQLPTVHDNLQAPKHPTHLNAFLSCQAGKGCRET